MKRSLMTCTFAALMAAFCSHAGAMTLVEAKKQEKIDQLTELLIKKFAGKLQHFETPVSLSATEASCGIVVLRAETIKSETRYGYLQHFILMTSQNLKNTSFKVGMFEEKHRWVYVPHLREVNGPEDLADSQAIVEPDDFTAAYTHANAVVIEAENEKKMAAEKAENDKKLAERKKEFDVFKAGILEGFE